MADEAAAGDIEPETIERAAVVGCGVIGAAWASRMVLNGVDVAISDLSPDAERIFDEVLSNAVAAYDDLGFATDRRGSHRFASSIAGAVTDTQFVQESVPERLDIKAAVFAEIEAGVATRCVDRVLHLRASSLRDAGVDDAS